MNADDPSNDEPLADVLRASRRLETPPSHVVHRAYAVWRPRTASAPAPLLERLLGALTFDSAGRTALAHGLRSLDGDAPRQIVYTAIECDVDLRVVRDGVAAWRLQGQLLGPADGARVRLEGWAAEGDAADDVSPAWQRHAGVDELCEFGFDAVEAAAVRLVIERDGREVVMPVLLLGP